MEVIHEWTDSEGLRLRIIRFGSGNEYLEALKGTDGDGNPNWEVCSFWYVCGVGAELARLANRVKELEK